MQRIIAIIKLQRHATECRQLGAGDETFIIIMYSLKILASSHAECGKKTDYIN